MSRHIVFLTANSNAYIDRIIDGTTIPHARRLEVARNPKTDELGNDIDIVVCGQFDNEAELATYKGSIRRLRPLRELGFDRL
ncbi:Dabb family protein [Bradyrhizobium vignae]|uniref:Dabb family protein n=1 Tax=Bradyrhizobium vignae TaxID=1549949 RepID=UPI00100BFFC0|nr:Dabb family protein [Bradyrhizobium vignae]RXH06642.1 Dabb family protein [Bradyrhizobium vignae]